MRKRSLAALSLLILAAVAGCSDQSAEESPARLAQRRTAYRQACASAELSLQASDDLETLEQLQASADPADPISTISARAAGAAVGFSAAYQRHAELREVAYAYLDSAVNHSLDEADSTRYMDRSNQFTIRVPEAGTVEENVIRSYQRNLTAVLEDEDHTCNWDLPF